MSEPIVVALLYQGCVSYDIALAAELLSRKYKVQNATLDGKPVVGLSGLSLSVQMRFDQIDLSNCGALLLPGGDVKSATESVEMSTLLKAAKAKDIFILALGEGIDFLQAAGLRTPPLDTQGELYAVDGKVIVAKPEGSIDASVELGARLDVLDAKFVTRTKDYYRGVLGRKIRALALALIKNGEGRYLFHKMWDAKRQQVFYRPVGGGVDFHEPARTAIVREIREELALEIVVEDLVKTLENIFVIEDMKGHEMVSIFRARFKDESAYAQTEYEIHESGRAVSKALWKTIAEIRAEGSAIYPVGLDALIENLKD